MLGEVKIHNSALLPKVQFNPVKKEGEAARREEDGWFLWQTYLELNDGDTSFYTEPPIQLWKLEKYH